MKKNELYSRLFLIVSCAMFIFIYVVNPSWLAMFLAGVSFGGAVIK